ncbi:hypothetical protein RJ55_02181 [Drechmeria coniospora]|nr:hypothetical protein RJ55_02181 [Drechmeria coniospora]
MVATVIPFKEDGAGEQSAAGDENVSHVCPSAIFDQGKFLAFLAHLGWTGSFEVLVMGQHESSMGVWRQGGEDAKPMDLFLHFSVRQSEGRRVDASVFVGDQHGPQNGPGLVSVKNK